LRDPQISLIAMTRAAVNLWIVQGNAASRRILFPAMWRPSHAGAIPGRRRTIMELTQLSIVLAALGVWLALATLTWS